MGKRYTLTAATGDGPKTCAFYFSDKGCRNGATCKFSHVKPVSPAASPMAPVPPSASSSSSSSVVSSEASEGEIVEEHAGAYTSLAPPPTVPNPFFSAIGVPTSPAPPHAVVSSAVMKKEPPPAQRQASAEKKKKRKKKSEPAPSENVFDLGKAELTPPSKNETNGTTAAPPKNSAATPPTKKAKKAKVEKQHPPNTNTAPPSFRSLQLPIASFSMPDASTSTPTKRPSSPQPDPAPPATPAPPLPLPTATPAHLKWKNAVVATREHPTYANSFNYERAQQHESSLGISDPSDWIVARPYGPWCKSNPASIAIDCEMCETRDPVSGKVNSKALCRVSVVNADNPSEVLLDTLVKPRWPVSDHRTWVNGIRKSDLENVQFTLEHAQTFMKALCSDQTVVVGHAVHNDLLAMRMVHHCNADTAMLFEYTNPEDGTCSLKNVALAVMKREMPDVHCSVNDARVALECAQHYVDNDGRVDPVEKVHSRSRGPSRGPSRFKEADTSMLLVHRLPPSTLPEHISEMFLAYTFVKPKKVPEIQFGGTHGKCNVEFSTKEHAELAYQTLVGEEREDKSGKKQKRIGLKGGSYVCVRKMKRGK